MARKTGPTAATVELVIQRDHRCCRRCGMTVWGDRGDTWAVHHRRPRKMGGTRRLDTNQPQNLIVLCSPCHGNVESFREQGFHDGFLVRDYDDPATVPLLVTRPGDEYPSDQWIYLRPDGTVSEWHPDEIVPRPLPTNFWQLDEESIGEFHTRYSRHLSEAAESAADLIADVDLINRDEAA